MYISICAYARACIYKAKNWSKFPDSLCPDLLPGIFRGTFMGSPTIVAASHSSIGAQEGALLWDCSHQVGPTCCSRLAQQVPRAWEWDGKYHWADLNGLFKRLQSICGCSTSSTCCNWGLDLLVNLQHCFNKQTPLLTDRVLLGEIQPAREVAVFTSMRSW